MHKRRAEEQIHEIANSDSGRVFLYKHAKKRDPEIGKLPLTKPQMTGVLACGRITEGPSPDSIVANGWKFTMTRAMNMHTYYVAGVLVPDDTVLVITGYEDISNRASRSARLPGGINGDGSDTE